MCQHGNCDKRGRVKWELTSNLSALAKKVKRRRGSNWESKEANAVNSILPDEPERRSLVGDLLGVLALEEEFDDDLDGVGAVDELELEEAGAGLQRTNLRWIHSMAIFCLPHCTIL